MSVQNYAIQLTTPGIASDGTTQPAGTNINHVLWDGVAHYVATDYAGNSSNVTLVLATPGMVFYQPPPAQVQTVQLWQAKAVLHAMPKVNAGPTLLDDANALATATGGAVQQFWTNAQSVTLDDPVLNSLAGSLGITAAGLAVIFTEAAAISL